MKIYAALRKQEVCVSTVGRNHRMMDLRKGGITFPITKCITKFFEKSIIKILPLFSLMPNQFLPFE